MGVSVISYYKLTFCASRLSVGRISCLETKQPGEPDPSPRITTSFEPQTSGDTTPSPESQPAATPVLNRSVRVERRVQSPDNTKPSVSNLIAVRFFVLPLPYHPSPTLALCRLRQCFPLASV